MIIDNIIIRCAKESDISDILKIEKEAFRSDICEERDVFVERINTFADGFLVVEHEDRVIGYISSEIWNYSSVIKRDDFELGHSISSTHTLSGDEIYISSFGILKEFKGIGLGKYLFDYFINYIVRKTKNPKSLILLVSENWVSAKNIYLNKGFEIITTFDNFFDLDNGLVMRKLL